ncbi:MAG: trypsin-like peptidase domain-containing protein [Planctomycetota bacterium]
MLLEFLHLEGSDRGRSDRQTGPSISIGSDSECELCLGAGAGILPRHAEVVIEGTDAYLRAQGTVLLNGRPAAEATLRDGDLLAIGDDVRLRVRLVREEDERMRDYRTLVARSPVPAAALPLSPGRLLHGRLGAAVTALFVAILVGGAYLASRTGPREDRVEVTLARERSRHDTLRSTQHRAYQKRLHTLRDEIAALERRMVRQDEVDERMGEVRRAVAKVEDQVLDRVDTEVQRSLGKHPDLQATRDAVRRIEEADAAARRLIGTYSASVCLVQGAYGFGKVSDGEWQFLREVGSLNGTSKERVPLMLEGDGAVFRVEYTGTGFLVDAERGIVLTNRHIAQPWWKTAAASGLIEDGYEARFLHLRAYFPGRKKPIIFDLARTALSEEADLAALRFEPTDDLPPALPLGKSEGVVPGHRILLLGYPSGLDALLARTEDQFTDDVEETDGGLDPLRILDALAARNLVRPLPTQGHISDVLADKVLFDAATAVGGSGGPLINVNGEVIAINYGILKAFRGANFGVPVSYANRLLNSLASEPRK